MYLYMYMYMHLFPCAYECLTMAWCTTVYQDDFWDPSQFMIVPGGRGEYLDMCFFSVAGPRNAPEMQSDCKQPIYQLINYQPHSYQQQMDSPGG